MVLTPVKIQQQRQPCFENGAGNQNLLTCHENVHRPTRSMHFPSLSLVLSCVFIAFVANSIYNIIIVYRAPSCNGHEVCYQSYLNSGPSLDLLVYLSDSSGNGVAPRILALEKFDYDKAFEEEVTVKITDAVRNNGSFYIHTIIIPHRTSKRPLNLNEARNLQNAVHTRSKLTKYAVPNSARFNLLQDEAKVQKSVKPVSHLKSKFAITLCNEHLEMPHSNIPFEIVKYLRINSKKEFMPIMMQDVLQTRLTDLVEIEPDKKEMNFTYVYNPTSIGKFKFLVQMESTFVNFMSLGFTDKDVDEVKGVFADTNLYLLCATMIIGGIHILLDFLSFKNDVSFWKSHKSMAGLSVRTVLWRSFSQTVVFLYLTDEGTSLLVLIPSGIGVIIEFWKITKVFKISISLKGFSIDKSITETEAEANTRKYDQESMKYISYLLYPLVVCAAVYSLIYQPHKSWYSWTISSMVNGVYVFGFLFMLPQLFVNYRLKSVAALPWRAFTYRAFNTFIDDIFAFIITMPAAHRIACFRDDVVFLIYLYQRWLYPVDKSRVDDDSGIPMEAIKETELENEKKMKLENEETKTELEIEEKEEKKTELKKKLKVQSEEDEKKAENYQKVQNEKEENKKTK